LNAGRNAAHCDVGISDSNIHDAKCLRAIDEAGLRKPRIEKMEFVNFKLALDIDGHSNAWSGLFLNLLMGCCTVKVGSPRQFRQWYYPKMQAWEHYVPVASDLGDLNEVVSRCLDGGIDIETIGRRGREFAEGLTFESEIAELAARLQALMLGDNDSKRRFADFAGRQFG
jgi:hypothetical protein